jgi:prepilin-type N-terminal cleavage/methylation domain-containing protein
MTTRPATKARSGFSLVELLVTLAVVGILGSLTSAMIYAGVEAQQRSATAATLSEEGATAMERIILELRSIPLSADEARGLDIELVSVSGIQWAGGNSVSLNGSSVVLATDGGTPVIIARDVAGLAIRCFSEDGAPLPANLSEMAAREVWRIEVELRLQRGEVMEMLRSRVFPRALAGENP